MMDTVRAGGYHEGFPVARLPMQALQEPTSTGTVLDNVSITHDGSVGKLCQVLALTYSMASLEMRFKSQFDFLGDRSMASSCNK